MRGSRACWNRTNVCKLAYETSERPLLERSIYNSYNAIKSLQIPEQLV